MVTKATRPHKQMKNLGNQCYDQSMKTAYVDMNATDPHMLANLNDTWMHTWKTCKQRIERQQTQTQTWQTQKCLPILMRSNRKPECTHRRHAYTRQYQ